MPRLSRLLVVLCVLSRVSLADAQAETTDAAAPVAPASNAESIVAAPSVADSSTPPPPEAPTSRAAPIQFSGDGAGFLPQRRGMSWDFQVEGGWLVALKNELPHRGFVRTRAGVLIMHEPLLMAFGPTFELGGLIGSGFGAQLDLIDLPTGFSIEAGGAFALDGAFVSHLSVGYALLGLEWQQRYDDEAAAALLFKLRIPVGAFVYLSTHR